MPDPFHSCTSYSPPPHPYFPPLQYLHFFFGSRKSCEIFCCCRQLVSSESERGEEESRGDGQQVGSWHIAGHRVMDGTGIAARRVAWNFAGHKYFYHFSLACLFVSVCFCFIPVGCDGCGHAGSPGVVATSPPLRRHTLPGN